MAAGGDRISPLSGGAGVWVGRAVLWVWTGLTLFSFGWIGMTSLKTNREFFRGIWALPQTPRWDNYARVWKAAKLGSYFMNSVVVTVATVVVLLLVASMAAYALSRFSFRFNRFVFYGFVAGMGIPIQLILIPLYFLLRNMHLLDRRAGLWLVYVATSLPFTIFVLTGFFSTLPSELEEAAAIEGCSELGMFWRIALPLASPGVLTMGVLNALGIWNEYLLAMAYIQTPTLRTLPVGLYALQVTMQYTSDWTGLFAGFVLSLVPSAVIYLTLQRYIVRGLTVGALKD